MELRYLPVRASRLPDAFRVSIGGRRLRFTVRYNSEGDMFTVTVADNQGNVIVENRPLVYGADLFSDIVDSRIPARVHIVPFDTAGKHDVVNRSNFMVDVFPFILEELA